MDRDELRRPEQGDGEGWQGARDEGRRRAAAQRRLHLGDQPQGLVALGLEHRGGHPARCPRHELRRPLEPRADPFGQQLAGRERLDRRPRALRRRARHRRAGRAPRRRARGRGAARRRARPQPRRPAAVVAVRSPVTRVFAAVPMRVSRAPKSVGTDGAPPGARTTARASAKSCPASSSSAAAAWICAALAGDRARLRGEERAGLVHRLAEADDAVHRLGDEGRQRAARGRQQLRERQDAEQLRRVEPEHAPDVEACGVAGEGDEVAADGPDAPRERLDLDARADEAAGALRLVLEAHRHGVVRVDRGAVGLRELEEQPAVVAGSRLPAERVRPVRGRVGEGDRVALAGERRHRGHGRPRDPHDGQHEVARPLGGGGVELGVEGDPGRRERGVVGVEWRGERDPLGEERVLGRVFVRLREHRVLRAGVLQRRGLDEDERPLELDEPVRDVVADHREVEGHLPGHRPGPDCAGHVGDLGDEELSVRRTEQLRRRGERRASTA